MFKPKLFVKYLISYTIVFLIPTLILGSLLYNSAKKSVNKEINSTNLKVLEQSRDLYDSKLEELTKLSIQISNNIYLSRSYLSTNYSNVLDAVYLLKNFSLPNTFYSNFYIYYPEHSLLYSPSGTYNKDYFFNSIFKYNNWGFAQLDTQLSQSSKMFVKPSENVTVINTVIPEKYVTCVVPLPYGSLYCDGAVIFLIEQSQIQNCFKNITTNKDETLFIFDENNTQISAIGNKNIASNNLPNINIKDEVLGKKILIGKSSYYFSNIKSKYTGWTYATLIPTNTIVKNLDSISNTALISFLLLFVIEFLLIYYLMCINYKPLAEITSFTLKIFGANISEFGGLESVKTAVDTMDKKMKYLEGKMSSSIPTLKNKLLTELLKGYFSEIEEFNIEGKEYTLCFTKDFFTVVIFLLPITSGHRTPVIRNFIETSLPSEWEGYSIDSIENNRLILILSSHDTDSIFCFNTLENIKGILKNKLQIECTLGLGKWVSSPDLIASSYLEACSALDYRLIKGKNSIISFTEIENSQKNLGFYPSKQMRLLENSLSTYNIEEVKEITNVIIHHMKENDIPLITARSLCYNIIQSLIQAIYKSENNTHFDGSNYPDIISLAKFETIEELAEEFHKICIQIFSNINSKKSTTSNQIDKIKEYINNNYTNSEFSLQNMEAHLHISLSYMSHYFKVQTNENISEYVGNLRMEKAKKLLVETNSSLQELASKVGYTNTSSFIRKFKQTLGTTPGAYRDLHKHSK